MHPLMRSLIIPSLALLLCAFSFAREVILSFGTVDPEAGILEVYMINVVDVYGFQFMVDNIEGLSGAAGGSAETSGFTVSTSPTGTVLGFSFSGSYIPAGEGILTTLTFSGLTDPTGQICYSGPVFSGMGGIELIVDADTCWPGDCDITNLQAAQRTDGSQIVDISYDLGGAADCTVTAEFSLDGGSTYIPADNTSGDIGTGISPGIGKAIQWQAGVDAGDSYSTSTKIGLTASVSTGGTCIDIDGNSYETVIIGTQEWMAENLKVTHYRNGDPIPTSYSNSEWAGLYTGAYAVYNNDPANADIYGNLYNWYAVDDARGVCPEGWHVPTDEEWMELEMALGMSYEEAHNISWRGTNEGSQLAGNADLWFDGNLENNGEFGTSGFLALPGGSREYQYGDYGSLGYGGIFWSSTASGSYYAWYRGLYYDISAVARDYHPKRYGFSVRCLGD